MRYLKILATVIIVFIVLGVLIIKDNKISRKANESFEKSLRENKSKIKYKDYAILIDYSRPIFSKRLWLIDLKKDSVILNCHVGHAFKSGLIWAHDFSNVPGTNKSSVGPFISGQKYSGRYGPSFRIDGLDSELNHRARQRTIVFHPTVGFKIGVFVIPTKISYYSLGCFMVSLDTMEILRKYATNGRFIYVYHKSLNK